MLAVRATHVGKQYRIGTERVRYETLRESLMRGGKRFFSRRSAEDRKRLIWALRDVSFEIGQGEVVGLIGRNGAGKTTMLRLLSRITEPTKGRIELRGRVGSLLEVGTGFHPELTGRENVFLNGAVLGMTKREIERKFDEIVDFSGVETFIDTPVKRYSSGMQVRLAFAVAAHLEPEILLIDEVLAVGDAEFQKKSLGKMESVGRSGRTVIFVSHSMPTVTRLCSRAILFEDGLVAADGPATETVARYLSSEHGTTGYRRWPDLDSAPGNDAVRIRSVRVLDEGGATVDTVDMQDAVGVEIRFTALTRSRPMTPMITVTTLEGVHVFNALDTDDRWQTPSEPGDYAATAWVPPDLLNEGIHVVSVFLNTFASGKLERNAEVVDAVSFQVVNQSSDSSAKGPMAQPWGGAISPRLRWDTAVEERPRA